jgi:hypothetical protein
LLKNIANVSNKGEVEKSVSVEAHFFSYFSALFRFGDDLWAQNLQENEVRPIFL